MFSKDTPFEHVLAGVPAALRMALKERSLDQPGVLVASIQDVLEEGMAAGIFVDTGISTISIGGIDPINSISSPSSSSLSHTVPSTSSPLLSPVSHESSIPGKPVVKTIRSKELWRKEENWKRRSKMLVEGREEWQTLECSALVVVLQSVSRRCRGRRRIWTFRTRFGHPLKVLIALIFTDFRKIRKVAESPPG